MPISRIRNIFIFFIVFLPLQYAMVGILGHFHSEPWPAFVFPGFKNVYDGERGITVNVPELSVTFADSTKVPVPVHELLADAPVSHHKAIMSSRFNSDAINEIDSEIKSWIHARLSAFTGSSDIVLFSVVWEEVSYQIIEDDIITDHKLLTRDIIHFDE